MDKHRFLNRTRPLNIIIASLNAAKTVDTSSVDFAVGWVGGGGVVVPKTWFETYGDVFLLSGPTSLSHIFHDNFHLSIRVTCNCFLLIWYGVSRLSEGYSHCCRAFWQPVDWAVDTLTGCITSGSVTVSHETPTGRPQDSHGTETGYRTGKAAGDQLEYKVA